MSLIRYSNPRLTWHPFERVTHPLFERMTPLRDLFESALQLASTGPNLEEEEGWMPLLDMVEAPDEIVVKVEVAGMKKGDFEISLDGDTLTISGERKFEEEKKRGESLRSERFFGYFRRTVTLPAPVKKDKIHNATYEDGILTIRLPKAEEAKSKKIDIELK